MEQHDAVVARPRRLTWLWLVILIIAAVIGFLWWTGNLGNFAAAGGSSDRYQAVFLSNDQVYFGKLAQQNSQYPVLTDVFYLQVTQTLQPIEEGTQQTPRQNINLVKLGGELHGPEDEMHINRSQIIFFEDLKEDSQVVQAIKQFKENQVNQETGTNQ
jgi:hypothetical protein